MIKEGLTMVLSRQFYPPRGISEDVSVVTGYRCYWHLWVEDRDATKHPAMQKVAPKTKIMSTRLRLRSLGLNTVQT